MESVVLIAINNEGKVLSVSRKTDHNDFGLIAGKIEENETPEKAVIRELREETGIETNINSLKLLFQVFINQENFYIFLLKTDKTPKQMENEGVSKWSDWEEVLKGSHGIINKSFYTYCKRKNIF